MAIRGWITPGWQVYVCLQRKVCYSANWYEVPNYVSVWSALLLKYCYGGFNIPVSMVTCMEEINEFSHEGRLISINCICKDVQTTTSVIYGKPGIPTGHDAPCLCGLDKMTRQWTNKKKASALISTLNIGCVWAKKHNSFILFLLLFVCALLCSILLHFML